jgi:hypothetical protein
MTDRLPELISEMTHLFGFSEELSDSFSRLIVHFSIESMTHEEQAQFLVEFAQLARDGYTKRIREAEQRGDAAVMPYASYLVKVINELTSSHRNYDG